MSDLELAMLLLLLLAVHSSGILLTHPPVGSPASQSRGELGEKLSIQLQNNGLELPSQTVKGPHTAGRLQGSAGWAYTVCQECFSCDQIFSLIWPETSIETNVEDDSSSDSYVEYSSSWLLTYLGTSKPLVRASESSSQGLYQSGSSLR